MSRRSFVARTSPVLVLSGLFLVPAAEAGAPLPSRVALQARLDAQESVVRAADGDIVGARLAIERALTVEQQGRWCVLALDLALAEAKVDAMRTAAERAETCAADDPDAALLRARVWIGLNDSPRAERAIRTADYLLPGDPRVALLDAQVHLRLRGDVAAFAEALREARRRAPALDLSTLPLDPAFGPRRGDDDVLTALEAVLRAPARPAASAPLPSPHAGADGPAAAPGESP